MKNLNENKLNEDERKFLEVTFNKRTTLQKSLEYLDEIQLKFLKEKGIEVVKNYPGIFRKIKKEFSRKYWIYIQVSLINTEVFKDFEFGIEYWEQYRCGELYGFYPYAMVYLKKKTFVNDIEKYFKENSDLYIEADDDCVWIGLEDWKILNLQNYPKTFDELSEKTDELCEEIIRLMKDCSKKHK